MSTTFTLRVALYKAKHGQFIDKLINWFSGQIGYSHCELVLPDGMFFSSSDEDGGVRLKKICPTSDHWRFYQIDVTERELDAILRFCWSQLGKRYDWLGVLGFILPTKHEQGRWFCSEIVVEALREINVLGHVLPWKVNPNSLYLILEALANKEINGFIATNYRKGIDWDSPCCKN